ncbi:unnamed protein product [Soboliphyme baturini]|uniref:Endo/exonuclease/phosphatase domain-containing protein n=1 Tax=Soboliphyme baturini TaxID=241478 RepID=A0A183J068_9BILA|nr:unnamed protein product [Soboliphyme baturini]
MTRVQAGVDVPVEHNFADRIIEWKHISGRAAIVRPKLEQAKTITMLQKYALNLQGEYETLLEEVQCALTDVPNTESVILMGDFNAHVGVDVEEWNGEIGKKRP